jgi:cytochrome c oxidase subunit IV
MAGHHVVSWRIYVVIFLALAVLTVVTVQAAGRDFGVLNTVIALGIAAVKATLVMLFFMHVRYSPRLTTLVLFSGFVFLGILILFTVSDYISRPWPITPAG